MRTLLLPALALTLAGCQSAYYGAAEQFGIYKRDILVDRVEESRDAQADAIVAPHALRLEAGVCRELMLQGERPRRMHTRTKRRQDADAVVAELVAKALRSLVHDAVGKVRAGADGTTQDMPELGDEQEQQRARQSNRCGRIEGFTQDIKSELLKGGTISDAPSPDFDQSFNPIPTFG